MQGRQGTDCGVEPRRAGRSGRLFAARDYRDYSARYLARAKSDAPSLSVALPATTMRPFDCSASANARENPPLPTAVSTKSLSRMGPRRHKHRRVAAAQTDTRHAPLAVPLVPSAIVRLEGAASSTSSVHVLTQQRRRRGRAAQRPVRCEARPRNEAAILRALRARACLRTGSMPS